MTHPILTLLQEGPQTAEQLARALCCTLKSAAFNLALLQESGEIRRVDDAHPTLWTLPTPEAVEDANDCDDASDDANDDDADDASDDASDDANDDAIEGDTPTANTPIEVEDASPATEETTTATEATVEDVDDNDCVDEDDFRLTEEELARVEAESFRPTPEQEEKMAAFGAKKREDREAKHASCEIDTPRVWKTPRLTWDVQHPPRPIKAVGLEARILEALEGRGPQARETLATRLGVPGEAEHTGRGIAVSARAERERFRDRRVAELLGLREFAVVRAIGALRRWGTVGVIRGYQILHRRER